MIARFPQQIQGLPAGKSLSPDEVPIAIERRMSTASSRISSLRLTVDVRDLPPSLSSAMVKGPPKPEYRDDRTALLVYLGP